ncbi:MAG: hypothetical protein ACM3SR_03435 [Ignavibacteriales bacterium]
MSGNQAVKNEKPQDKVATKSQGNGRSNDSDNSTMFNGSKSRHDKGMVLYKSGRVSISSNGLFIVSGYYEADTEKMTCTCPDYRTRKEPCKYLFAAMLFIKNRGKATIEHLEGHSNGAKSESDDKPKEAHSRDFNRQATITRLAVLNTATEILKTHNRQISFDDVVALADRLEAWALGS